MTLRKELVCFIETTEQGIEASVRAMKGDPTSVVIEHEGYKFAISRQSLAQALLELQCFYKHEPLLIKEENLTLDEILMRATPTLLGPEHGCTYETGTPSLQSSGDAGSYKDIEYGAME